MISMTRIIFALLLSASYSYACDCIEPPMDINYTRANLVFYGEVIEAGAIEKTTFRVSQWFKPNNKGEKLVQLPAGQTNCDYYFRVGEKWLIFTNGATLTASQCGGSRLLEQNIKSK